MYPAWMFSTKCPPEHWMCWSVLIITTHLLHLLDVDELLYSHLLNAEHTVVAQILHWLVVFADAPFRFLFLLLIYTGFCLLSLCISLPLLILLIFLHIFSIMVWAQGHNSCSEQSQNISSPARSVVATVELKTLVKDVFLAHFSSRH